MILLKKVQTRLLVFLALFAVFFGSAILYMRHADVVREDLLFRSKQYDEEAHFDRIVVLKGKPLEIIVNNEYTLWSEMADFISKPDAEWADENLVWLFKAYGFSATWAYDANFVRAYSVNKFDDAKLTDIPVPKEALEDIFTRGSFAHFFIMTHAGLMEIRGATVHPTTDSYRKTPARGYFFAGRLWDNDYLTELSELTDSTVKLVPADGQGTAFEPAGRERGVIAFSRVLKSWDGSPVAWVEAVQVSATMKEIRRLSGNQMIFLSAFMLVALFIMVVTLMRLVNAPLRRLTKGLKQENPAVLHKIENDGSEFGDLAKLIVKFFEQRDRLIKEVEDRKRAEANLKKAQSELEDWSRTLEQRIKGRTDELKATQEKLFRAEKLALLGQLSSSVSHELRTPLTAIKNSIYFLKMLGVENQSDKVAEHLSLINKEVDACTQVISNMLGFARPKEPIRKEVDLNEVVRESISLSVVPSNIKVKTHFGPDVPLMHVDSLQMRQICDNMIKNAVEAMSGGGELAVSTFVNGPHAVIEFGDTGIGIPPENLPKIFDPLFSTFPKGTGLGLSVCQQIAESHGGFIEVESEPGKGTTFTVKIPVT